MIEKNDLFNGQQWETNESNIGSIQELLINFKNELENQNDKTEVLSNVDRALSMLTYNVTETFNYESEKLEQILQKHPELVSLMNSVVKKNTQKENNETIDTDLLQQEKSLLFDLLNSILASLNKQIDEESVKWYAQWSTEFFKFIPWYSFLVEKALA
jgi:hypothetical protein